MLSWGERPKPVAYRVASCVKRCGLDEHMLCALSFAPPQSRPTAEKRPMTTRLAATHRPRRDHCPPPTALMFHLHLHTGAWTVGTRKLLLRASQETVRSVCWAGKKMGDTCEGYRLRTPLICERKLLPTLLFHSLNCGRCVHPFKLARYNACKFFSQEERDTHAHRHHPSQQLAPVLRLVLQLRTYTA